ncbi:MAG: hypothetical protein JST73_13350, partial [Actinobacteria bacterium]|nr:hypothetical protein [Actinomycetota bacterium]
SANPSLPACTYAGYQDSPIPTQKSPNFWAAIEGYTNNHANGDAYSTSGAQHRNTGYWYAVDIPASGLTNPVSVQAWDLNSNCKLTCRTAMGDDSGPRVRMVVYKAGALKFDMTQITAIAGCDTGWISSGTSATYSARWAQICSIGSAQAGDRYYINVISNDGTNGMSDGGYNGYALRTVAGTFPAACMDVMPVGNVACYGTGTQPALSAYGDMEMYNGIGQGTPTQFYLANVIPNYAGKTLQIDLFDPGDGGSGTNSWMTVMGPSTSSTSGQKLPASACTVQTRPYGNNSSWTTQSLSNGPNSTYNNTCTFQTTNNGDNSFGQDNWVRITIPLPSDYGPTGGANWTKCNPNVTDPVNNVGSCWWQMSYFVTGSNLSDYTTWSASVVGDPVHLVQ